MKYRLVILRNEHEKDFLPWINACDSFKNEIEYRIVNLTRDSWFEELHQEQFDYLLAKPSGIVSGFKELYDERLMILSKELKYPVFPTLDEVLIYENKRYFSYWLKAHNIPHPETYISYYRTESLEFIDSCCYPIVAKLNIGASGKGVEILHNKSEAQNYIFEIFSTGKSSKTGPRLNKGKLFQRAWTKLNEQGGIKERLSTYKAISSDFQRGFLLFQEYVPHCSEWRVVRIEDSYFAHKKIMENEKASGSLLKKYENPPLVLLNFVKKITDKFHFTSQAVDIFEINDNTFLVNEMQCIFGQSDPYQMKVDNVPGRYTYSNNDWVFEEGLFNDNQSYNLRLEYLIRRLDSNHK